MSDAIAQHGSELTEHGHKSTLPHKIVLSAGGRSSVASCRLSYLVSAFQADR